MDSTRTPPARHSEVEWRPVPGYEGRYAVSADGRVMSLPRKFRPLPLELRQHHARAGGYPTVELSAHGVSAPRKVHVLVAAAFLGPRPEGAVTRHLDGNPQNNNIANLRYGTPSENTLDAIAHGTWANSNKTHCPSGHPFTPENTGRQKRGNAFGRYCRECHRAAWRAWKERRDLARRDAG